MEVDAPESGSLRVRAAPKFGNCTKFRKSVTPIIGIGHLRWSCNSFLIVAPTFGLIEYIQGAYPSFYNKTKYA